MADKEKVTIGRLLEDSERGEVIDWLRENIGDAEKCLVICGVRDPEGGLLLKGRQMGFRYQYEIQGFADWAVSLTWCDGEEEGS